MESTTRDQLEAFAFRVAEQVRKNKVSLDEGELAQLLTESQIALAKIARAANGAASAAVIASLGDIAKSYWDRIAAQGDAVPTGFARLNDLLGGGLQAGRLMVLLGAPGAGKTTLANQIAHHVANGGVPAVYLATEDTPAMLLAKTIARMYSIQYKAVLRGEHSKTEAIEAALADIAQMKSATHLLYIESSGALPVQELKTICGEHFNRYPADAPGLLVVDYLQRCARALRDSKTDLREAVTRLTEQLHDLAKELNCSVIALASQNRASGYNSGANDLASAKESGDIEFTTDVLMALGPENEEKGKQPRLAPIGATAYKLNLAKNRQGGTGQVALDWWPTHQKFSEAATQ